MVDRNMLHACHPRWSFSAPTHSVRQRIQVRHCVCQGNRNTPVPAPPDGARAHTPGWMQVVIVQYEMVMSKPDMGMLKSLSWSYMVVDEVSHVSALPLCHVSWPRCASVPSLLQRERVGAGGGARGIDYRLRPKRPKRHGLSPTHPVPQARAHPVGQSWPRAQLWPTGSVYVCMYI